MKKSAFLPYIRAFRILMALIAGILLPALTACSDDPFYESRPVGEGECMVQLSTAFKPFASTSLGATRAAGDSYDGIRNLCVLVYDEAGTTLLTDYCRYAEFSAGTSAVDQNDTQALRQVLPYGKYRIYGVANMGNLCASDTYRPQIATVDGLKAIRLEWQMPAADGSLGLNDQMLGAFRPAGASGASDETASEVVTLDQSSLNLHAWLVRAASKVTVAYDATSLKEGITIEFRSLAIKKIPRYCFLGEDSKATAADELIAEGGIVEYPSGTSVSALSPYFPAKTPDPSGNPVWTVDSDPHSDNNPASLFFFENNQGTNPEADRLDMKDWNGNGILDPEERFPFQKMPYATYIEVQAFYRSTNPACAGEGTIIYRFMLGANVSDNFDASRNHHYRLTLRFNGYANDYDWHIDPEKVLVVPQPEVVSYRGVYFLPDESKNNLGNTFAQNDILVESFTETIATGEKAFLPFTLSFRSDENEEFKADAPEWLTVNTVAADNPLARKLELRYYDVTDPRAYDEFLLRDRINAKTVGTTGKPHNLAGDKDNEAQNTANSYIVNHPGTYIFPLVYGNAREGNQDNKAAYSGFSGGDRTLATFVNYLDKSISDPWILSDIYGATTPPTNLTAWLVWEDERDLVSDFVYDPTAYGGKGGIRFTVNTLSSNGGNAVLAIKDPQGRIMWSWQIWVTYDKFVDEWTDIVDYMAWIDPFQQMPVNLGWCPGKDETVRYYPKRSCQMKVDNGTWSTIVDVIQESQLVTPVGNNTYYQWGRKDPFVGDGGASGTNKPRYFYWWIGGELAENPWNPTVMNTYDTAQTDEYNHENRPYSKDILGKMIQNPDLWNNPRCKTPGLWGNKWQSDDKIYSNLWLPHIKTVYDPCPPGFQVTRLPYTWYSYPHGSYDSNDWFNVALSQMLPVDLYRKNVVCIYTSQNKLKFISFPENGYRDYDNGGSLTSYGEGHLWESVNDTDNFSFNFKFCYGETTPDYATDTYGTNAVITGDDLIWPMDGFGVRPTRQIPRSR